MDLQKGDIFSFSREFNARTKWEVIRVCVKCIMTKSESFLGYTRISRTFKFEDYENGVYMVE